MSVPTPIPPPSSLDPRAETVTRTVPADDPATLNERSRQDQPLPAVPGFTVVRWLGGGGMGDVYEVVDQKLNVTFALKMVRADRLSPGFAARFRQEVRAMMGLDHPHVARIFRHDEVDGRPYFTMRFVRGGTLADRLPALRADPRACVRLLVKVIDAVEYLHRQGQVHRDLKPTNILLDEAGEPFLSDFGLVKDLAEALGPDDAPSPGPAADFSTDLDGETVTAPPTVGARPHTRPGAKLGTYGYMSPEQARGDTRRIGPATDVWALGVVLYEMLTGNRPDRDSIPPAPAVDPELDRIVLKCLAADPAERYPSAAELAAALRAWLEPAAPPPTARRRRWPAVAVAVGLVVVGGGITLSVLRPWKDEEGKEQRTADQWRAWARTELREGRDVTLVGRDGKPAEGFRFVAGAGPEKAETDPAGWWTVSTTAAALAELLDDPGIDDFILSGEFRPNEFNMLPRAGLYVASRRVPADGGPDWHYQVEFLYQEFPENLGPAVPEVRPAPPPPPPQKNRKFGPVEKQLEKVGGPLPPNTKKVGAADKELRGPATAKREARFHASPFTPGGGDHPEGGRSWTFGRDRPEAGGPWRKLAIHARGASYRVAWDGGEEEDVPDLPADRRDRMQTRGGIPWPGPALEFTPRGGLGVIVVGGSAAVRNVTLSPGRSP